MSSGERTGRRTVGGRCKGGNGADAACSRLETNFFSNNRSGEKKRGRPVCVGLPRVQRRSYPFDADIIRRRLSKTNASPGMKLVLLTREITYAGGPIIWRDHNE